MKIREPIPSPPRWIDRFLEWYCSDRLIDEVQGDLHEAHYYRSREFGKVKANLWYFWDVMRFFRPSSFGKRSQNSTYFAMHGNYFKVTYRNFVKNKIYSSINLSGLIVGIVSCLLISLHVLEELSYDTFHPNADNKYRLVMDMFNNGDELSAHSAPVFAAVGPNIKEDFPEIVDYNRILPFGDGVYSVKQADGTLVRYNETKAVLADENFFTMFGFELVQGNPKTVLTEKFQVVLSESTATKYFGDENPIGKPIFYRGVREYVVSGVMRDFPENSHLQFDIICSLKTWDGFDEWVNNWGWYDFYTYIEVNDNTDISLLREKAGNYLAEKKADEYAKDNTKEVLILQHLPGIHLYSEGLSWEMGDNGGADQVYFLSVIAALILIIAWVNFINLSTARAVKRAREVGVRKVVGASRKTLISQFLAESFFYNLTAMVISLSLLFIIVPIVNSRMDITLDLSQLLSGIVVIVLLGLILSGTMISGLYPAMVMTGFKPINVLKGNFYNRRSKFGFRQILVILQFTISVILVLGTILAVKQLRFMQSQDLGINVEQTMVVRGPSAGIDREDLINRKSVFENTLEQIPSIKGFTASNVVPGVENFSISSFRTRFSDMARDIYRVRIDENFVPDFEINLLSGRNFVKGMASDSNAVLINERAMLLLGFDTPEDALGEILNPGNRYEWRIIGVVSNYHHSSLKEAMDPILFTYRTGWGNFYSMKLAGRELEETIVAVERAWDEVFPDNPFDFFFLDEFFDRQYKSDKLFNAVFNAFAGLAIFVACLGLFGLVSFTAEQAKKEISIRKVLGASITRIIGLFARDYAILLFISILIAFPLGFVLMERWLDDFAYRTTISAPVFISGGLIIVLVATVTVSFKSMMAARSNPVDALREE